MIVRTLRTGAVILGDGMNTHTLPKDTRLRGVLLDGSYPTVVLDYDVDDEGRPTQPEANFYFALLRPGVEVPFGVAEYLGSVLVPGNGSDNDGYEYPNQIKMVYWGQ